MTLTLTCHDAELPDPFDEQRPGLDHVAFGVDGADIEALKERFEQLGVTHSEITQTRTGGAMITFRDPDTIQLEVFGGSSDPTIAAGGAAT